MRVVDLRRYQGPFVYVGRPMPSFRQAVGVEPELRRAVGAGSALANPFTPRLHLRDCLRFYREWLVARVREGWPPVIAALGDIRPESVLGCWCVELTGPAAVLARPAQCHAQVIWDVWSQVAAGMGVE